MFSLASTTLVLSLYNAHARHVTVPNLVVGMALFYGGLAQFLAGMWGFAAGDTFVATGKLRYLFPPSFRVDAPNTSVGPRTLLRSAFPLIDTGCPA
jgi:hypothetical protein